MFRALAESQTCLSFFSVLSFRHWRKSADLPLTTEHRRLQNIFLSDVAQSFCQDLYTIREGDNSRPQRPSRLGMIADDSICTIPEVPTQTLERERLLRERKRVLLSGVSQ